MRAQGRRNEEETFLPLTPAPSSLALGPPSTRVRTPPRGAFRLRVRTRVGEGLQVPSGGIAPPSPVCETGILLLEEPGEDWLRATESHGPSRLMRPAEALASDPQ
jgi:hypothetical protein